MNCPDRDRPMTAMHVVECKTGDARKHKCESCGGEHYQQLTDHTRTVIPPKREKSQLNLNLETT